MAKTIRSEQSELTTREARGASRRMTVARKGDRTAAWRRDDRGNSVDAQLRDLSWNSEAALRDVPRGGRVVSDDSSRDRRGLSLAEQAVLRPFRAHRREMKGARKLLDRAAAQFVRGRGWEAQRMFPWNFHGHLWFPSTETVEALDGRVEHRVDMEQTVRFAGWLEAGARFQPLRRLLGRVLSHRGWHSPRTKVRPDEFIALTRMLSPGRASRLAAKVRDRANQILSPFGLRVAAEGVFRALLTGGTRVGKLAAQAADFTAEQQLRHHGVAFATRRRVIQVETGRTRHRPGCPARSIYGSETTTLGLLRGYAALQAADPLVQAWVWNRLAAGEFQSLWEALAQAPERLRSAAEAVADGVDGIVDVKMSRVYRGLSVCLMVAGGRGGPKVVSLVREGRRTFHARATRWRDAVEVARDAWQAQDAEQARRQASAVEARKLEEKVNNLLLGTDPRGSVATIGRRHSVDAGNCEAGTEAWIVAVGLNPRDTELPLAAAWKLAVASGNSRAKAACRVAAREFLQRAS